MIDLILLVFLLGVIIGGSAYATYLKNTLNNRK